jgi:transcriptional regulator with XRE-family HTH domain
MTKAEIGQVLKRTRKERKITYYYVHKRSGVSTGQQKSIENGKQAYTIDSLLAVCEVFGYELGLQESE